MGRVGSERVYVVEVIRIFSIERCRWIRVLFEFFFCGVYEWFSFFVGFFGVRGIKRLFN